MAQSPRSFRMTVRMQLRSFLLLAIGTVLISCSDDDDPVDPGDSNPDIEVPTAYSFDSRFETGQSSVSYPGQTVRNLLIQDLKIKIDGLAKEGAQAINVQDLLNLYEYSDDLNLSTLTTVGDAALAEAQYSEMARGKNLVGKISDAVVIGTGMTADALIRDWFNKIAANSADSEKLGTAAVYTDDDNVDMTQMVNKLLLGAVAYYQGTGVYLNGLLDQDNSQARQNDGAEADPYTAMEHFWDEAFGYYGAARDYASYSDDDLAGKIQGGVAPFARDANGDNLIDFRWEYNFGFSRNAGKRDNGGTGVDFSKTVFDAILGGRTAISNQGSVADITEFRRVFAENWENVIAATVVHYVNETMADVAKVDSPEANQTNLNKHWAEMRAFTMALQYNPFKKISDSQLNELAAIMTMKPPTVSPNDTGAYQGFLQAYGRVKSVLQQAYGFSDANMESW